MTLEVLLAGLAGARRVPGRVQHPQARPQLASPNRLRQPLGGDQRPVEHLMNHGFSSAHHLARVETRKESRMRSGCPEGRGLGGAFSHRTPRGWCVRCSPATPPRCPRQAAGKVCPFVPGKAAPPLPAQKGAGKSLGAPQKGELAGRALSPGSYSSRPRDPARKERRKDAQDGGGGHLLNLEPPWLGGERRGSPGEGSLGLAHALARTSGEPPHSQSQQPGRVRPPPESPRPAPARCPLPLLGPRFPGHPALLSPGVPFPRSQGPDRWPNPERHGRLAAAPPGRTHSPSLPPWRSSLTAGEVGWFKPGVHTSLASLHHRTAAGGGYGVPSRRSPA
uniref:Uncharacterized protein n=1 Tax=Mustela putorius furo TaxID=9669 RepID=M3Z6E7_MUSPF